MTGKTIEEKHIEVPLLVGSEVYLAEEDDVVRGAYDVLLDDTVAQYVPSTGLLRFEEADVGRAEFKQLLEQADRIEIEVGG